MDDQRLQAWLDGFKAAWEGRNPDAAVALFTPEAEYQISPFRLSLRGHRSIRAFWNDVPRLQESIAVTVQPVTMTGDCGVGHFAASFRRRSDDSRIDQDGVLILDFAADGRCRLLRMWAEARSRPSGSEMLTR